MEEIVDERGHGHEGDTGEPPAKRNRGNDEAPHIMREDIEEVVEAPSKREPMKQAKTSIQVERDPSQMSKDELQDALPYVDQQYSEEGMKSRVDALVAQEMRTMPPFDRKAFDEKFPVPELTFEGSRFLKDELERIALDQPMEPMDTKRYRLENPTGKKLRDISAWQDAINNSRSQLEHQSLRLLNLELANRYGPKAWLAYNEQLEGNLQIMQSQLEEIQRMNGEINRQRKTEQSTAAVKLRTLESKWQELIHHNVEIQKATFSLENEVARAEAEAAHVGVTLPPLEE